MARLQRSTRSKVSPPDLGACCSMILRCEAKSSTSTTPADRVRLPKASIGTRSTISPSVSTSPSQFAMNASNEIVATGRGMGATGGAAASATSISEGGLTVDSRLTTPDALAAAASRFSSAISTGWPATVAAAIRSQPIGRRIVRPSPALRTTSWPPLEPASIAPANRRPLVRRTSTSGSWAAANPTAWSSSVTIATSRLFGMGATRVATLIPIGGGATCKQALGQDGVGGGRAVVTGGVGTVCSKVLIGVARTPHVAAMPHQAATKQPGATFAETRLAGGTDDEAGAFPDHRRPGSGRVLAGRGRPHRAGAAGQQPPGGFGAARSAGEARHARGAGREGGGEAPRGNPADRRGRRLHAG